MPELQAAMRPAARRRVAWVIAVLVAGALAVTAVVTLAGGGGAPGPPTAAAALMPADALGYANLWLAPGRAPVRRTLAVLERLPGFPLLGAAVAGRLDSILSGGGTPDFGRDVAPWLGDEGAIAVLDTGTGRAGTLLALSVRRADVARAFLVRSGARGGGVYRGHELLSYPGGAAAALVRGFLLVGRPDGVRAGVDAATGAAPSLAHDGSFRAALRGAPDDRVGDVYLSAAGVQRILGAQRGIPAALGALLSGPALSGVAVSLSPAAGGLRARLHVVFDPTLAALAHRSTADFTPRLPAELPASSMLLVDTVGLSGQAPALLRAAAALGFFARVGPLLAQLGSALRAQGFDVHGITGLFDGESAVAVIPSATGGAPAVTIVARVSDPAAAAARLAALELPLQSLFPAPAQGPGQAPLFQDVNISGITVHEVALVPGFQLAYAVTGGLVIVSSSVSGIVAIAHRSRSLAGEPLFRKSLSGSPGRVGSLLFLDFSQLLSLGEQTGLIRSARPGGLRADLDTIRAISLYSTRGEADTTAELFLQIP